MIVARGHTFHVIERKNNNSVSALLLSNSGLCLTTLQTHTLMAISPRCRKFAFACLILSGLMYIFHISLQTNTTENMQLEKATLLIAVSQP